jgi:hypothetical protein
MDRAIIGYRNAGFDIIEAEYVTPLRGVCLGKSGTQYVTWEFREDDGSNDISFYFGHYCPGIDTYHRALAYQDYHNRLADAYAVQASFCIVPD